MRARGYQRAFERGGTLRAQAKKTSWRESLVNWLVAGLITILVGGFLPIATNATPANPDELTLSQSNGIQFQARLWGDEFLNGFETTDRYTIVYDEYNAQWTYAMPDPDGYLVPSPLVVGVDAVPTWLPQQVRPEGMALEQAVQMSNVMLAPGSPQAVPTVGTLSIPLILITFKDRTPTYAKQDFQNLLFGTGNKSMRDYYQEVSYGKLNISSGTAGVIGWYVSSQNHDYYGESQGKSRAAELVKEAVQAADATVNFANYDSDNNCVVDGLMVVHQGTGTESSGDYSDIWSHKWAISYTTNDTAACGQIKVNTYSIQPEKLGSGISTMGVFAHEFGHVLGLPDLYDTDYTSEGVGNWDLMSGGSWNGVNRGGDTPAHLSAWGKIKLGWVTPIQVASFLPDEPIEQASAQADVYRFLSGTEYYLVENRNRTGFDTGLPGSGLAIWHVDDAKGSNTAECIPPTNCAINHYKVALVQTDNLYQLEKKLNRGDAGDLFPGGTGKTVFNDTTAPSAKLYEGSASLVTVKNISSSGATMKATLCYGNQGNVAVSPTSLDFGEVNVGSSKTLVLTVSNTGCADLSVGTLTGSNAFQIQSKTCSTTLVAGGSCTITFAFVPTVAATVTNTFTLTTSANSVGVLLKGIGKSLVTYTLTVNKTGTGTGMITSAPAGINCGTDCSEPYTANTVVTLTATATSGSIFTGWAGTCTGTNTTCTVTLDTAKTVTANFAPVYTLSVSKTGSGAGTVTSSPAGINCGTDCSEPYTTNTVVTLTATATSGSIFTGWTGVCTGTNTTCAVTLDAAKTATANFAPVYTLSVSKAGTGTGTVTSIPTGINCGADCSESYNPNAAIKLTATPIGDSIFAGWSGCTSTTNTCDVTMDAAKNVTATFTLYTSGCNVTSTASAGGNISPLGTIHLDCGTSKAFTMTPNAGYRVSSVLVDSSSVGAVGSYALSCSCSSNSQYCTTGSVNINQMNSSCINGHCTTTGVKITCNSSGCSACDAGGCRNILYNGTTSISGGSINCSNGWCNYSANNGGSSSSGSFSCGNGSTTTNVLKKQTIEAKFDALALQPDIQPSRTSVDFGQIKLGSSSYQLLYIWNKGSAPLQIGTVSLTGTNASEFKEYYPAYYSCTGKTVVPNSYCYEYIQFSPTLGGTKSATLVIPSNDPDTATLNIPLSATVPEVTVSDPACNLTPTIQSTGKWNSLWAKINTTTGQYDVPDAGAWNPDRIPNENDVVLINANTTMIGIPFAKVKALCNKGILKSKKDSALEIQATDGIANYGTIRGNIDQQTTVKDQGSCAQKDGNSVILKAGTSFTSQGKLGDWWWYGTGAPIYNKGLIEGGPGGNEGGTGIGCAGHGGDALVLGRNTMNDIGGVIRAGKGGNLTTSTNIPGSEGGLTQIWGKLGGSGNLINKGEIYAGDGGKGCSGGPGGNLWLVSLPDVYLYGTHKSGVGGTALGNCANGKNGFVQIEPSLIALDAGTNVEGGDVTIFGGNDWTLDLSNAGGVVVRATGNITLQVGEGSVINLTGNNTPVLEANGEVKIIADHILLDEGVQLSDVIKATNITVEPAKILYAVALTGPGKIISAPNSTLSLRLTLANSGPTTDTYTVSVSDTAGWQLSAIEPSIEVAGIDAIDLVLKVTVPETLGATDLITVTATSQSDSTVTASAKVSIEVTEGKEDEIIPPPPIAYNASGTILDQFGDRVVGVTLTATNKADSTKVITGMTDDTGYWQVTGLIAGDYTLTAEKTGYTFTSQDFSVGNGENAQVEIKAIKIEEVVGKYTAYGTVVDKAGKPMVNANIAVEVSGKTTTTTTGYWEISGLSEGVYEVSATANNYSCSPSDVKLSGEQYKQIVEQPVVCEPLTTLRLTAKASTSGILRIGQEVTYTFTVVNGGQQTATGVVLSEQLPKNAELISMVASNDGVCDVNTMKCTLPDLAPGAKATVTLTFKVTKAGSLNNVATLTSSEYPAAVQTTWREVNPYLSVVIKDSPDPVPMKGELHYQVVVALDSQATQPAEQVKLTLQLPEGTVLKSIIADSGTCDSSKSPTITCDLNDLGIGTSTTVNVDVTLIEGGLLVLTHEAKVTASHYPTDTHKERTSIYLGDNNDVKVDVILAVDITNSMQQEINGVKKAIEDLLKTIDPSTAPTVALVTFKDDVRVDAYTGDLKVLLKAVKSLKVDGGGTCPEASAEALELAIKYVKEGGTILLATDAPPYNDADLDKLAELIKSKNIKLQTIITEGCSGTEETQ